MDEIKQLRAALRLSNNRVADLEQWIEEHFRRHIVDAYVRGAEWCDEHGNSSPEHVKQVANAHADHTAATWKE